MVEIGGFQKLSLLEYPKKISCIIFTAGCNFRCSYCYNPDLVNKTCDILDEEKVFGIIKKRKDYIDAVMITGGEPTIYDDLPIFIEKIKKMGFLVGLETNGTNPEMINTLISKKLIDYIAMDIKAPPEKYKLITNVNADTDAIKESVGIIMKSGIEYEFRTTCYPELSKDDFIKIFKMIKGAENYALQQFLDKNTLIKKNLKAYPDTFLSELKKIALDYVKKVEIRQSEAKLK